MSKGIYIIYINVYLTCLKFLKASGKIIAHILGKE